MKDKILVVFVLISASISQLPQILIQAYLYPFFYDRMNVRRSRFIVNKTNRRTEFQFYWYYYFTCFRQPFCPSSVVGWNCIPSYSW